MSTITIGQKVQLRNPNSMKHLDKLVFRVAAIRGDHAEIEALEHGAFIVIDKGEFSKSNTKIPKNTCQGVVYTFDLWNLVDYETWEKALAIAKEHKLERRTVVDAIQNGHTFETPEQKQEQKPTVPEQLRKPKKNFAKRNKYQAIRDTSGLTLVYDGEYVSDGYIAISQGDDFVPATDDIERDSFANIARPPAHYNLVPFEPGAVAEVRDNGMAYHSYVEGRVVLISKPKADFFRHYYPDCVFHIDIGGNIVHDFYAAPVRVTDLAGEYLGIVVPLLPKQDDDDMRDAAKKVLGLTK